MHSGGQRFDPAILHQETLSYFIREYFIIIINIYIRLFEDMNNQLSIRKDEYLKKFDSTQNFFLCINQAFKGVWRMPWH